MKWKKLSALMSENTRNGIYKSKEYMGSGFPIVKMGQQFGNRFIDGDISDYELIRLSDKELENYGLIENDLLFSRTSVVPEGVGMCSIVREKHKKLVFESNIIRVRLNSDKINPEFVFRFFQSPLGRGKVLANSGGTSVKTIKSSSLKDIEIPTPKRSIQDNIVNSLRAYDDLIKNNRRRIQLLEESARLLYQEWFVHLRFPGHEHVKVVDGVPEGWSKEPLENLLVLQRGFDLPVRRRKQGEVPIVASTGINGFHNEHKVSGPGVVTGRSGSLGKVLLVSGDFWPLNTTLWVKQFKKVSPIFAMFLLQSMKLENYNGGAAVPTLNRNDVHKVDVLCPDTRIISDFDQQVKPIFEQIEKLKEYSDKLAQARDLLLPRLMNGELTPSMTPTNSF